MHRVWLAYNNLKTGIKLILGFVVVALLIEMVAVAGSLGIKRIYDNLTSMYSDRLMSLAQLGLADTALDKIRGELFRFLLIPKERAEVKLGLSADIAIVRSSDVAAEAIENIAKVSAENSDAVEAVKHGYRCAPKWLASRPLPSLWPAWPAPCKDWWRNSG
jgi:hypothetical protein